MTAKELRENDLKIGNLVEYNGFITLVYSIIGAAPRKDARFDRKTIIELFDGSELLSATVDEIKPIPLTEEWLLKLGFKLRLNQEWMLCKGALCLNTGNNNIWEYGNKVITAPKYVHQLMNLYFALAGKELEVKL